MTGQTSQSNRRTPGPKRPAKTRCNKSPAVNNDKRQNTPIISLYLGRNSSNVNPELNSSCSDYLSAQDSITGCICGQNLKVVNNEQVALPSSDDLSRNLVDEYCEPTIPRIDFSCSDRNILCYTCVQGLATSTNIEQQASVPDGQIGGNPNNLYHEIATLYNECVCGGKGDMWCPCGENLIDVHYGSWTSMH